MKRTAFIFFLLLIASLMMSCRSRDIGWDYHPEDIVKFIDGIGVNSISLGGGSGLQNVERLKQMSFDPEATIYFANYDRELDGDFGPIESIAGLNNGFWTDFDQSLRGLEEIKEIRFYFGDRIVQNGQANLVHENVLIIEYQRFSGPFNYVSYANMGTLGDSTKAYFETSLQGDNGQILELTSYDVNVFAGGLNTNIQLRIDFWDRLREGPYKGGRISGLQAFQGGSF